MKLHISSFDLFSRKQRWFWSKRTGYSRHAAKLQFLFTSACLSRQKLTAGFLNVINTDFTLYMNNFSATVHNKLPPHSKSAILHNTRKKARGRTWRIIFGGQIGELVSIEIELVYWYALKLHFMGKIFLIHLDPL